MTIDELKIELECYQMYFKTECNIENLSLEEWAHFISIQEALATIDLTIFKKEAPILRLYK